MPAAPHLAMTKGEMLEILVFSLLNGVLFGMLLFMLSSGLTLIFSMMGVLNFAHASFFMLGAYFAYQISTVTGFWIALILAPLLVGGIGMLIERYGLRRVHRYGHVAELLFTFGLAFLIEEVVVMIWGRIPVDYGVPADLNFTFFTLFGSNFPAYRAFILLIAVMMFVALFLTITRTRIGLIIQAALTHPDMVAALGHNVPRVFMMVFGGGTALAALAGVIGGPILVTEPGMAFLLGPIIFVVVVFGGMGSLGGAFVASLLIGIIQTLAVALDWSLGGTLATIGITLPVDGFIGTLSRITVSQTAPILPYLMLVLMLIFRPKGLMGTRES